MPLIVSHMFVFYFGIMADLTPPVALAAFAAAPIARESGMKIGMQAVRIALPGFVIPFMAIYDPTLMLQPVKGLEGTGYALAVVWIVVKVTLAILSLGGAFVGYLQVKMVPWERLGAVAAAALLVAAVPLTDEIGLAVAAIVFGAHVCARGRCGLRRHERLPHRGRQGHDVGHAALQPGLDAFGREGRVAGTMAGRERRLVLEEARNRGSGAGMEPPPEARRIDGWYVWQPSRRESRITLAASGKTGAGWQLCSAGTCQALGVEAGAPVVLEPCQ